MISGSPIDIKAGFTPEYGGSYAKSGIHHKQVSAGAGEGAKGRPLPELSRQDKSYPILQVKLDGDPVCDVTGDGYLSKAPDGCGKAIKKLRNEVRRYIRVIFEYVPLVANAPPYTGVHLEPEDRYRLLNTFNGYSLAGSDMGDDGYKFITWQIAADGESVGLGHYYINDYDTAKLDFAERSGLLAGNVAFSEQEVNALYHALKRLLEEPHLLPLSSYQQMIKIQRRVDEILPLAREDSAVHVYPDGYRMSPQNAGFLIANSLRENASDQFSLRYIESGKKYVVTMLSDNIPYIIGIDDDYFYDSQKECEEHLGYYGLTIKNGTIVLAPEEEQEREQGQQLL